MFRTTTFAIVLALGSGPAEADVAVAVPILPAYVLELPASVHGILIAETDTATLHRFVRIENGFEAVGGRYMSIGENGVGKQRAWDRRTPLGIYFVHDQLDTSTLHEKYGATAFPLDYPNAWDRLNDRSGDGIWIHGVTPDAGSRPPLDTDGCIALANADLLELEPDLRLLITPVLITRKIREVSAPQATQDRDRLKASLAAWVRSFRSGDWHEYLSLYAREFRYRGLDRDEWSAYRVQSAGRRTLRDFTIDDLMLLADPEEDGLFLVRFRQTIVDDSGRVTTVKRLYWRRMEDGKLKIVAEDNG